MPGANEKLPLCCNLWTKPLVLIQVLEHHHQGRSDVQYFPFIFTWINYLSHPHPICPMSSDCLKSFYFSAFAVVVDVADIVNLYHHHFAAFRSCGVVMLTYDKEAISRVVTKHGNMGDPRWINFTVPIWSGHSKNKNCWNGCSGSPMGGNSGVVEWMLGRECNRLIKCKPNKGAWEREPPARAG